MVFEKLAKLVAEQFGVPEDEITMDTDFVNDLNATSIDIVELMLDLEDAFDLDEVGEEDLQGMKTMNQNPSRKNLIYKQINHYRRTSKRDKYG